MEPNPQRPDTARLHCSDGPALLFGDGWAVYSWHGVSVPQQVIESPETLTAAQITTEPNAEVRRVMLERFGTARYIRECGAQLVHRDDWGTLWRAELTGDEPLVMVQVVNATPEPDGTFHEFFLRVQPELRPMLPNGQLGESQALTAHNAVASTFGLRGEEYWPIQQT